MKPRLLDLFCGAGGAAMGYARAGFEVVGVDIEPQPHYPFEFVQADVFDVLRNKGTGWRRGGKFVAVSSFDAIHASPVCKGHSKLAVTTGRDYSDTTGQIAQTRAHLERISLPWVIENVPGAPLRPDFRLCGCRFDLPGLRRERWFEVSWHVSFVLQQPHHHTGQAVTVSGHGEQGRVKRAGLPVPTQDDRKAAMGIDWMNRDELSQAIPPAYTEFIGGELLAHLGLAVSA